MLENLLYVLFPRRLELYRPVHAFCANKINHFKQFGFTSFLRSETKNLWIGNKAAVV